MPLIIENGSLVEGATSYVTVEEFQAFAEARGSAITNPEPEIEAAAIRAIDYLEGFRGEFQGSKVAPSTQSLQFPRFGVSVDGYEYLETEIPLILKNAQCQLMLETINGLDLLPTGDGREVIREKVDVIETEYAPGGINAQPSLKKVQTFLLPLLRRASGVRVIRA